MTLYDLQSVYFTDDVRCLVNMLRHTHTHAHTLLGRVMFIIPLDSWTQLLPLERAFSGMGIR